MTAIEAHTVPAETTMVSYVPATEQAVELPEYGDSWHGFANDGDYVDNEDDIAVIAAQTLVVENEIEELRPRGKFHSMLQRFKANLASRSTANTENQNYNKKLMKYNGTTREFAERELKVTNQGLRYEFEDLFQNISYLKSGLIEYKKLINKKVNTSKVQSFAEQFNAIKAEAKRLKATVKSGHFLEGNPPISAVEDTFKFLETSPLNKLNTEIAELRVVYTDMVNIGDRNTQALEEDCYQPQPKGIDNDHYWG